MTQTVCGKNTCLQAFEAELPLSELWLLQGPVRKEYQELYEYCQKHRIPIHLLSKDEMKGRLHCDSHQGIALVLSALPFTPLDACLKASQSLPSVMTLMLDSIFDPQNLGALMRVAETFQLHGVIWSKNRGAHLTPAVHKSSVGASLLVDKVLVSNLVDTLIKAKKAGYWVVCSSVSSESSSLYDFSFPEKTLLILGSEGKGVQKALQKHADFSIYLPMRGSIDSLNVSQAASCMAFAYRQQHP